MFKGFFSSFYFINIEYNMSLVYNAVDIDWTAVCVRQVYASR